MKFFTSNGRMKLTIYCMCGNEEVTVSEKVPLSLRKVSMSWTETKRDFMATRVRQDTFKKMLRKHLKQIIVEMSKCPSELLEDSDDCCYGKHDWGFQGVMK